MKGTNVLLPVVKSCYFFVLSVDVNIADDIIIARLCTRSPSAVEGRDGTGIKQCATYWYMFVRTTKRLRKNGQVTDPNIICKHGCSCYKMTLCISVIFIQLMNIYRNILMI